MFDDEISKAMNGIFDNINQAAMGMMSEGMKEYEIDQKRPDITSLPYKPIPAEQIEAVKKSKAGLFKGGFKKKLIASMEDGRTKYAEVLVLARFNKIVRSSDEFEHDPDRRSSIYCMYYKIADLTGRVIRYDVPMLDDDHFVVFNYNTGDSASETGNQDTVDPGIYQHMILLQYYLNDDQNFVLLTKEDFEHLNIMIDNLKFGGYYHILGDGVGHKW